MQVTFNTARYAVHAALDTAFPDIRIMGEEIKQGLNPPCFFVRLLEPEHTQELGRRYMRLHPFAVRYYGVDRANEDYYDMAERLTSVLQQINVNDVLVRGSEMNFEIVDEVLHFFVNYNFLVWEPAPDIPKMQELDVQEGLISDN
ncbi:hypothetical protein EHV15_05150 [Paenibacillus oralis]|uniref:Uncharacterized protein n=1 Tax=Paenibacillus oralis TaxID=2490856 RepID=A0A3P3TW99_9BACL|nr:hypothetical protein [Paenibacillus oralis]RRJ62405.1 hypothetical protein EHV15_05150 [Paenibacillus oralis]